VTHGSGRRAVLLDPTDASTLSRISHLRQPVSIESTSLFTVVRAEELP
jgi:hypothetical protein